MAETPTPISQNTKSNEGFFEHSRALLAALSEYLSARMRLAGIETKEAFVHYAILLALAVAALGVVVFGYIFFCIGLVVLIAHLLKVGTEWTLLVLALLHFGLAVAAVLIARAKLMTPMFSATISEFKKDHQWLSSTNNTPKQS